MEDLEVQKAPSHTINTDFEVRSLDVPIGEQDITRRGYHLLIYLFMGLIFGVILVKAEVISWFRIQEMFRLQSFHMYGVIGSAVITGIISVQVIKRLRIKTIHGEKISLPQKSFHK